MSTRCQIGFYRAGAKLDRYEALIYKHHDGYPEGVLPLLTKFCKEFQAARGLDDVEYAAAQYLYELILDVQGPGPRDYPFFGISNAFHGDTLFYYAVYPDRIEVYEIPMAGVENYHKIQTIKLKGAKP